MEEIINEITNEITAISQTLEELNIMPTIYNMERLLGCQQHLLKIRGKIQKIAEETKHENDSAE